MVTKFRFATFAVLAALVAGCGGGGNSQSGGGSLACGPNFATPNYVQVTDPGTQRQNTLRYWPSFPVRVYIENEETYDDDGTTVSTSDLTRIAMSRWVAAADNAPVFLETDNPSEAKIKIAFAQTTSAPGSGGTLGRTVVSFFPSNNQLVSAEITINLWPNMTRAQFVQGLRQTIAHEFGHALYLQGHSDVAADTMYYQTDPSKDGPLTTRDINSFHTAYCGNFGNNLTSRSLPGEQPVTEVVDCPR